MEDSKTLLQLKQENEPSEKLEIKISDPLTVPSRSVGDLPNEVVTWHIIPYLDPVINKEGKKILAPALRETCRHFSGLEGQKIIERVSEPKTYKYLKKTTLPIIKKSLDIYEGCSGEDLPGLLIGISAILFGLCASLPVGTVTAMVGLVHDGLCYYERRQYQLHNRPNDPHYIDYQKTKTESPSPSR